MDVIQVLGAHGMGVGKKLQPGVRYLLSPQTNSSVAIQNCRQAVKSNGKGAYIVYRLGDTGNFVIGEVDEHGELIRQSSSYGYPIRNIMLTPDDSRLFAFYSDASYTYLTEVDLTNLSMKTTTRLNIGNGSQSPELLAVNDAGEVFAINSGYIYKYKQNPTAFAQIWQSSLNVGGMSSPSYYCQDAFFDTDGSLMFAMVSSSAVYFVTVTNSGVVAASQRNPVTISMSGNTKILVDPTDKSVYYTFRLNNTDYYIVKVNSAGSEVWRLNLGTTLQGGTFIFRKGHVYAVTQNPNGSMQIWKITPSGTIVKKFSFPFFIGNVPNAAGNPKSCYNRIFCTSASGNENRVAEILE